MKIIYNLSYYFIELETDKFIDIGNNRFDAGSTDFLDNQEHIIKDFIDDIPCLFDHFLIFIKVKCLKPEVLSILVHQ